MLTWPTACPPRLDGQLEEPERDSHATSAIYCMSTVIPFVWVSVKFGTCNVVSVNGTLAEDKMRTCRFKGECDCAHFSVNKCPIYTHDGANAKISTNSQILAPLISHAYPSDNIFSLTSVRVLFSCNQRGYMVVRVTYTLARSCIRGFISWRNERNGSLVLTSLAFSLWWIS